MKKAFFILFLSSLLFAETPSHTQKNTQKIRVGILNGPTSVPALYLMENSTITEFTQFPNPQYLIPKLLKNEIDVGFLPVNQAIKIIESNKDIVFVAITGNSNVSLISTEKFTSLYDLNGRKVNIAGQGATPEYLFRDILESKGLNDDVELDFSIPTNLIVPNLLAGKIKYAVVPEPFVTIAKEKTSGELFVFDLQKHMMTDTGVLKKQSMTDTGVLKKQSMTDTGVLEKQTMTDTNVLKKHTGVSHQGNFYQNFPMTAMVVLKNYVDTNFEVYLRFLEEYESSVSWTNSNPHECGKLAEKHKIGLESSIIEKAIPNSAYVFNKSFDYEGKSYQSYEKNN